MNRIPRPVFLIAAQRTGTNVFGRLLDNSGLFDHYGEVFDPNKIHGRFMSFFHYINSENTARDLYCLPNETNIRTLFDKWLDDFLGMGSAPYALFDIKQNALHHFNTLSQPQSEAPFLIRMAREKRIPVIRIVRKNLFEQAVSWQVAIRSNVWHIPEGSKPSNDDIRFELSKDTLLQTLWGLNEDNLLISRFLQGYPSLMEFQYESMYPNHTHLDPSILERLSDLLQDDRLLKVPTALPFGKTVTRPINHISNIEEVADWLKGTPFDEILQDSMEN